MEAIVRTRPVLGVDVGKQSHWCCLVTADGEVALNAPVANREGDIDELVASLPGGTLRDHAGPGPLRGLARRWPKRES